MISHFFSLVALAATTPAFLPTRAASLDLLYLAPTTPWRVEITKESCRLDRTFGNGDQKTVLVLERFGPIDRFAMFVAGKPLAVPPLRAGNPIMVTFQFGPGEAEQKQPMFPAALGDLPGLLNSGVAFAKLSIEGPGGEPVHPGLKPVQIDPLREAAVKYLSITVPSQKGVLLELGSMGEPMAALRKCTDELLTTGVLTRSDTTTVQKTQCRLKIPATGWGHTITP